MFTAKRVNSGASNASGDATPIPKRAAVSEIDSALTPPAPTTSAESHMEAFAALMATKLADQFAVSVTQAMSKIIQPLIERNRQHDAAAATPTPRKLVSQGGGEREGPTSATAPLHPG